MAATALTVQKSLSAGVTVTMSAPDATDGIEFVNTGKEIVVIHNGSASPVTATIQITSLIDGIAIPDRTVTVPASGIVVIGPFSTLYNQSDDYVRITFSAVASVTCGLIKD